MDQQNQNVTSHSAQQGPEEVEMTFWDHLDVLRWAFFRVAVVVVFVMVGCFCVMPWAFDHIVMAPTTSDFFLYKWFGSFGSTAGGLLPDFSNDSYHVDIININVASQFMTHISTSFWFALVLSFPYIIYEIWKFIAPALYSNEKKSIGGGFLFGTVMFFIGCAVGYCLVFPFTFRFLTEYHLSDSITNQISLNSYMGTFMCMIFIMGLVFELPLLALVLSSLGLIRRQMLKNCRKGAIMVLLILAAIITPTGDPFTLTVVFLPLYMLYELSILIVRKDKPQLSED